MRRLAAVLFLLTAAPCAPAWAGVLTTKEAALAEAFPGARVEQARSFLSEAEAATVAKAAGTPLASRAVLAWRALDGERLLGTAYLERHLVRTLPETVLVFVSPEGRVQRVEVLTFDEPRDYLPPDRWLAQFEGKPLDRELQLKRGIRGISGATLSGRALTEAVRRVLAVHDLLEPRAPAADAGR
jgi:hypothetical protein